MHLWLLFGLLSSWLTASYGIVARSQSSGRSREPASASFLHGVASGDPLPEAVILWTRVTPRGPGAGDVAVHWEVWPELPGGAGGRGAGVRSGAAVALQERDHTVKVDVTGLRPNTSYGFRFAAGDASSPEGRFRLPPLAGEALPSLRYAVFSCSNWQYGRFAAYAHAARSDLDFWVHLGDYIYEYGQSVMHDGYEVVKRDAMDPPHEIVSLDDYRRRHRLYRTDPDLQALSASAPMIAIWDDHEVADNTWMHGAGNHQPSQEGDFHARQAAAMQAYHEWLPTRHDPSPEAPPMKWRAFQFGNLAEVLLLETRQTSRTRRPTLEGGQVRELLRRAVQRAPAPERWPGSAFEGDMVSLRKMTAESSEQPNSHLLGYEQLGWIREKVGNGSVPAARWNLVMQQLRQPLRMPDFDEALRSAAASADAGVRLRGEVWASALANATAAPLTAAHAPTFVKASLKPGSVEVSRRDITEGDRTAALMLLAASRYKINWDFDGWSGYEAERRRFLAALDPGPSSPGLRTVVYGGDSHNAWAGLLRSSGGEVVAHEFDGMSVSSYGQEKYVPWLPPDLHAAAWEAANRDLSWADVGHRGFMLVSLSAEAHAVSFVGVDPTVPGTQGSSFCLASFATGRGDKHLQRQPC